LDINFEDLRCQLTPGFFQIENPNIYIQASENLYYRVRIPKLLRLHGVAATEETM